MKNKRYNLEDRLVDFAVLILSIAENLPQTYAGKHLSQQIIRSGTAPALLYGEAQAAESRADFIHKMKIALKELRETYVCLKIIGRRNYLEDGEKEYTAKENDELIAIFTRSIDTARKNRNKLK